MVDATDLQAYPDKMMKAYCEAVGISNMTKWEPIPIHNNYKVFDENWCHIVNNSSGFIKCKPGDQKPVPLHELPTEVVKCIEESQLYYREMCKDCIKPM